MVCLWNITPLLWKGWSTVLTTDDAPSLESEHNSRRNAAALKEIWTRVKNEGGTLWQATAELVRFELCLGGVCSALCGVCGTLVRPLVLKAFVKAVMHRGDSVEGMWLVPLFGTAVAAEMMLQAWARHIIGIDAGYRFHGAMSSVMLEKVMKGNRRDSMAFSLLGNDISKIVEELKPAAMLPSSVVGVITGCIVLLFTLGWSGLLGVGVLLTCLMFNKTLANHIQLAEKACLEAADDRMSVVHVLIDTFKGMKLFAWEDSFNKALSEARESECNLIQYHRVLDNTSCNIGRGSPILASAVAILSYYLSGNQFEASDIFAAISVFQALTLTLSSLTVSFLILSLTGRH